MPNSYISQVPLRIGAKEYTLQIDYQAIGSYQTLFPDNDWTAGIVDAFERRDMPLICKVLEVALKRNHEGEISSDQIFDLSPPYEIAFKAMEASMCCSLFGAPDALKGLNLDPPLEEEEASGTAPLTQRARWRGRGNWLMKWLSRAQNSG